MTTIGERITSGRKALGLSQSQFRALLAEHGIPWSQGTVSKVENGTRAVRLDEAPALCAVLDTTLEHLAGTTSGDDGNDGSGARAEAALSAVLNILSERGFLGRSGE